MKAIIRSEYGGPEMLRMAELPRPLPGDDEVLVRVRAASVNAMDWRLLRGTPLPARLAAGGLRRPARTKLGHDFAGDVEAVGSNVTAFEAGDAVFGSGAGAFAEYVCARATQVAPKPGNATYAQAASVPVAAITALQALRDAGHAKSGQRVLLDGAAGGVGTFAIQIARTLGTTVTAVCSGANAAQAAALGAERVIDYTREDFLRDDVRYDLVVGVNAHRSILDYRRVLAPAGTYVLVGGGGPQLLQAFLLAKPLSLGRRRFRLHMARSNHDDLALLGRFLADRTIVPAIECHYGFDDVARAIAHVERGHARGKVVIDIA